MPEPLHNAIIEQAKTLYAERQDIDLPVSPDVYPAVGGFWVQATVWVGFESKPAPAPLMQGITAEELLGVLSSVLPEIEGAGSDPVATRTFERVEAMVKKLEDIVYPPKTVTPGSP